MVTRRQFIIATSLSAWGNHAISAPEDALKFLENITKTQKWATEKVKVILPPVTEQGQFVPISVEVDVPWTTEHKVTAIHLVAERNPKPHVVSFYVSPDCWLTHVTTKIQLIKTQIVIAAAVLNNGDVLIGKEMCKVVTPGKGCG